VPHVSSQIIGHESQIEALKADIFSDNVAHAYLFHGPAHLGKMTTALWFAQELLCSGLGAPERLGAAHQIDRLTHPDLFVLDQLWIEEVCEDWEMIARTSNVPQGHRQKSGARTDTISIDDIRALHTRLHEKSLSRYRCCIIRSADRMLENASNVLLKILEEPPPGLVFILTADSSTALLPTIVSRSRILAFRRVADRVLAPLLSTLADEDRQFILSLAQGAPGTATALCADPDALRTHRIRQNAALSFWHGRSLQERLQHLDPLLERGEESEYFLLHLALALRQHPSRNPQNTRALTELVAGLQTNAHRQLLAQRFAMSSMCS
jgi:hypothetical protein